MLFTVIPLIVGLAPVMGVLENVASVVTGEVDMIFIRLLGAGGFGGGVYWPAVRDSEQDLHWLAVMCSVSRSVYVVPLGDLEHDVHWPVGCDLEREELERDVYRPAARDSYQDLH